MKLAGDEQHNQDRIASEQTAAWLARVVAEAEPDPHKAALFTRLADAAEAQAAIIEKQSAAAARPFEPDLRARIVARLVRRLGPKAMRPVLAAMKVRGLSIYSTATPSGHAMPTSLDDFGSRHKGAGGGTLRAAVFGVNDGLVSNTCLILGVAGSDAEPSTILVAGVAGLLAGAFSMAAGEYISMLSQREMFEYQIGQEREEIETYPEEEAEELALIYAARGLELEEARRIATRLLTDKEKALDTLAREELGLNPEDLGSPVGAAFWSFIAFAAGAILPLLPFLLEITQARVFAASLLSGIALFGVGMALSLFSGRNGLLGGLRMLGIGTIAAAATYSIGMLFGVAVG